MIFGNLIYGHLYILMFQNGPAKKVAGFRALYQTYSNSTCQYPRVSGGVCCRLLSSVVVCWYLELPGDVWRVFEGYMGQFPEDGNFGGFMSNFFSSRRLLLQNQWILTTSIDLCWPIMTWGWLESQFWPFPSKKKHIFWYPEVDPFFKFYSYFNAVAQPNLHCWTGFDFLIIFLVKFWWFSFFLLPL